jgi:acyl dehydratase
VPNRPDPLSHSEGDPLEDLGVSPWYEVTQAIIDSFGGLTEDLEPLHNDPEWCRKNSPYKVPIAYGFLTLSLFTKWLHEVSRGRFTGVRDTVAYPINYGFDRTRLISPVRVGSRIRARVAISKCEPHRSGHMLYTLAFTIEIEGEERPALVSDWLLLWVE